jgi:ABC-type multidrug transport system fused ATPase/permease subunit
MNTYISLQLQLTQSHAKQHEKLNFVLQTPQGRIISRFSKDINEVDNKLNQSLATALSAAFSVTGTLAIITYGTPFFAAIIPLLALIYIDVLKRFRPVVRDLKRLSSISRSPVYAFFSETLGGVSTIRAYDVSEIFESKSANNVDTDIRNFYLLKASDRWVSVRLGFLGALVTSVAALISVYSAQTGLLDSSQAGVSLTLASTITMVLTQAVKSVAELENGMNSVDRLRYYTTQVPQEATRKSAKPPPESWPSQGRLEVMGLSMRYRPDTPLVLDKVSFTVEAGQRVGIVGRTGCGKSSLMLCLLRVVEPVFDREQRDGMGPVVLDGVDICKIGLAEVRA